MASECSRPAASHSRQAAESARPRECSAKDMVRFFFPLCWPSLPPPNHAWLDAPLFLVVLLCKNCSQLMSEADAKWHGNMWWLEWWNVTPSTNMYTSKHPPHRIHHSHVSQTTTCPSSVFFQPPTGTAPHTCWSSGPFDAPNPPWQGLEMTNWCSGWSNWRRRNTLNSHIPQIPVCGPFDVGYRLVVCMSFSC